MDSLLISFNVGKGLFAKSTRTYHNDKTLPTQKGNQTVDADVHPFVGINRSYFDQYFGVPFHCENEFQSP